MDEATKISRFRNPVPKKFQSPRLLKTPLLVAACLLLLFACETHRNPHKNPPKYITLEVLTGNATLNIAKNMVPQHRDFFTDSSDGKFPDSANLNSAGDSTSGPFEQSLNLQAGGIYSSSVEDGENISIRVNALGGTDAKIRYSENESSTTYGISASNLLGLYLSTSN